MRCIVCYYSHYLLTSFARHDARSSRYKTQANDDNYRSLKRLMGDLKEREDNSDVCAVCDEGGNLICCETCPDSVRANVREFWNCSLFAVEVSLQPHTRTYCECILCPSIAVSRDLPRAESHGRGGHRALELPQVPSEANAAAQPSQIAAEAASGRGDLAGRRRGEESCGPGGGGERWRELEYGSVADDGRC